MNKKNIFVNEQTREKTEKRVNNSLLFTSIGKMQRQQQKHCNAKIK